MYKYIITAIIIAIFAGCSAPKPKHAPSWYTSLPKDYKFFYSVASGETTSHAKNKAIVNLRKLIQKEMDSVFTDKTTKLKIDKDFDITPILKENERLVNTVSLLELKIEETAKFNDEELILLKIPRKSIFERFNLIANKKMEVSKENYTSIKEDDSWIKKYSILNNGMKDFAKLASLVEAKKVIINSYNNTNEVNYLNDLYNDYVNLKNEISIYVLSDVNSRAFVKDIKSALSDEGIELNSKPKSDKALKIFITSNTQNLQEYGFNIAKSLVKYSTYNKNKEKVAFKQHTFSAKSRKNYSDAKMQSIIHQKSKIKKLGIFDFLGVK
ncbi:MAG: hypothetical protein OQJ77_03430 [Thiovulaceae bacterium]|nr:hypothetical protein [Sulfurimonadaceae bacterium]MCW9026345.1 hypothetical protein [Sulfurimonadaceae bacterium]